MKTFFVVMAVVAVGGGGVYVWKGLDKTNHTNGNPGRPTTAIVESRDIHFAVNAAGEIGPADQVSVRPEINGKINSLLVDLGDQVKKGSVLFGLDDQDLQTQRSLTLISIEAARLNLEKTKRDYERSVQLYNDKLISQELFDDTKTEYDLAKNTLQKVEKDLGLVEYQLTKTKILAPFDCTILTRPVSVGQAVSGSGGVAGGTEVLTIANLNEMVINAHINQADVARLKAQQQVEVQVEAVPGLRVNGKVERIAPQATIKNNIKGFATRILLKDVDKRIRPGMTANIKIPVAAADNVLAVPLSAVFTELNEETQQNERFVYVVKNESYERRPVLIGVSDFFYAEVEKGLSSGEVVALELPKEELARLVKSPLGVNTNKVEASAGKSESTSKTGGTGKAAPATVPRTR
ncbi:MAG: efflux RND transporter periplasmic adaptor subunit [Verrucomicrobia bacterium]|nr:efflux RND transporter periplasmic adaptor subunit [Verrucomicrobiota bacterium]